MKAIFGHNLFGLRLGRSFIMHMSLLRPLTVTVYYGNGTNTGDKYCNLPTFTAIFTCDIKMTKYLLS